jgi:hypothetical protein
MSAIQIKRVSPELHEQLRRRAHQEGQTLSEYALRVLERDIRMPSTKEWLDGLKGGMPATGVSSEEIVDLIQEGRAERDEQVRRAITDRD